MKTIPVRLKERSYDILIGQNLLGSIGTSFRKAGLADRQFILVSQKNIWALFEKKISESFAKEQIQYKLFLLPSLKSSEACKTQAVWSRLIKSLASLDGKNRSLALLALGGGVVGDLTGFAAAVYRRGIPYVQIPTTLTAQVDSAIGGKTGVDLPEGKNLLGCIYQPAMVLSDISALSSLPDRHWSDGFAEVIKYGMIQDVSLFELLEKTGLQALRGDAEKFEEVIERCAKIKADTVEADEFDKKGVRIVLNFGHTAGHAIEAASAYSRAYTHGEAVGVGMLVACDISRSLGVLKDANLTQRLEKTLMKFNLPLHFKGVSAGQVLEAIGYDKKSIQKKNRFILPVKLGKVTVVKDIPSEVIQSALEGRKG